MQRIQIEVMLSALVVVLGVALAGIWLEELSTWAETADWEQATYVALCVLVSAALAGVGAGLRYGFPAGATGLHPKALKVALRPTITAGVTACIATWWASLQLATIPATSELQLSVLQVARWLDIGILILCFASAVSLVIDSRRVGSSEQGPRYTA